MIAKQESNKVTANWIYHCCVIQNITQTACLSAVNLLSESPTVLVCSTETRASLLAVLFWSRWDCPLPFPVLEGHLLRSSCPWQALAHCAPSNALYRIRKRWNWKADKREGIRLPFTSVYKPILSPPQWASGLQGSKELIGGSDRFAYKQLSVLKINFQRRACTYQSTIASQQSAAFTESGYALIRWDLRQGSGV